MKHPRPSVYMCRLVRIDAKDPSLMNHNNGNGDGDGSNDNEYMNMGVSERHILVPHNNENNNVVGGFEFGVRHAMTNVQLQLQPKILPFYYDAQ